MVSQFLLGHGTGWLVGVFVVSNAPEQAAISFGLRDLTGCHTSKIWKE